MEKEQAAFRRSGVSPLTETMRAKLPRPASDIFHEVERMGGGTLADAVCDRDALERRRHDEETERAVREYRQQRAEAGKPSEDEEPAQLTDDEIVTVAAQRHTNGSGGLGTSRATERRQQQLHDVPADVPVHVTASTEPVPTLQHTGLVARTPIALDIDRLWDWMRADPEGARTFLGTMPLTSVDLHRAIQLFMQGEATRTSVCRSIYYGTTLIGFGVVAPILIRERMAELHLFLGPDYRGSLPDLFPSLLHFAHSVIPVGVRLVIKRGGDEPGLHQLLSMYGFTPHVMYVQERHNARSNGGPTDR